MEFFRNLENKCGIRLENIVYYKVLPQNCMHSLFALMWRTSPTTLWWQQRRIVWWEREYYEKTQVTLIKHEICIRVSNKNTYLLFCFGSLTTALCSYPHWKVEIRDSSQISTTAPIFLQFNYFRQKYLEIASCSDSLLIYIWVRVDHRLLQQ